MNISKDEIPGIHYNARGKLMITGEYLALKEPDAWHGPPMPYIIWKYTPLQGNREL